MISLLLTPSDAPDYESPGSGQCIGNLRAELRPYVCVLFLIFHVLALTSLLADHGNIRDTQDSQFGQEIPAALWPFRLFASVRASGLSFPSNLYTSPVLPLPIVLISVVLRSATTACVAPSSSSTSASLLTSWLRLSRDRSCVVDSLYLGYMLPWRDQMVRGFLNYSKDVHH